MRLPYSQPLNSPSTAVSATIVHPTSFRSNRSQRSARAVFGKSTSNNTVGNTNRVIQVPLVMASTLAAHHAGGREFVEESVSAHLLHVCEGAIHCCPHTLGARGLAEREDTNGTGLVS